MSNYDINKNPELVKQLLEQYKKHEEESKNDPNSVLWDFKQELLNLGFQFQVLNQAEALMPRYKDIVLPIEDIWGSTYSDMLNNRKEAGNIAQYLYR